MRLCFSCWSRSYWKSEINLKVSTESLPWLLLCLSYLTLFWEYSSDTRECLWLLIPFLVSSLIGLGDSYCYNWANFDWMLPADCNCSRLRWMCLSRLLSSLLWVCWISFSNLSRVFSLVTHSKSSFLLLGLLIVPFKLLLFWVNSDVRQRISEAIC